MGSAVRTPILPSLLVATLTATAGILAACGPEAPQANLPTPPTASAAPAGPPQRSIALKDAGITAEWIDRSADACTDFYQRACGGLIKHVEIPADKAAWGPAQELQLHTEELLRGMLEQAAKQPGDDSVQKKLGTWYGACMDEAAAEKAGTAPLKPLFSVIDKVKDKKTLYAAITELHKRLDLPDLRHQLAAGLQGRDAGHRRDRSGRPRPPRPRLLPRG